MAKDRNGQVKPHNLGGSRFKDGSLREDIPLGSLHTQFNCNFSIVSQTNPHIHLFFFAPRGSVGRPVANRKGKGEPIVAYVLHRAQVQAGGEGSFSLRWNHISS
jgi:predicted acylesterase/phospholipase RssA